MFIIWPRIRRKINLSQIVYGLMRFMANLGINIEKLTFWVILSSLVPFRDGHIDEMGISDSFPKCDNLHIFIDFFRDRRYNNYPLSQILRYSIVILSHIAKFCDRKVSTIDYRTIPMKKNTKLSQNMNRRTSPTLVTPYSAK